MKTYVLMIAKNFFKGHINEGEPTNFKQKIESGEKIHTIRPNFDLWAKKIDRVIDGDVLLSLREWSETRYKKGSKQIELFKYDFVKYQKITYSRDSFYKVEYAPNRTINIATEILAENDGLTVPQFNSWFKNYDLSKPMIIIQFTDFKY